MRKQRIWLTKLQQLACARRYLAGESPPHIASDLGVCANNVRTALRHQAIPMRSRSEAQMKYSCNANAFDNLTPEAAYWLGFLLADGWLYVGRQGSPVISVAVMEGDKSHLDKLKNFLGTQRPLSIHTIKMRGKQHRNVRLSIRSRYLTDRLLSLGMNAKSLNREVPLVLRNSRDLWRGLVDGDGYVSFKHNMPRLGLCGGLNLLHQFLRYLRSFEIALKANPRVQKRIWRVDLTKQTARRAVQLLYQDATTALKRKQKTARKIMQHSQSRG